MNEFLTCALAWAAGVLLGVIFFGGLWWTVRKGMSSEHPVFWFFGSMVLRMSIALIGFYFVSGGHGERLLMCLVGFVAARVIVTWLTREASHAPRVPCPRLCVGMFGTAEDAIQTCPRKAVGMAPDEMAQPQNSSVTEH